jgi:hypothetical protein
VPKTCENFIKLCQRNYYDGTKFHRSIRHFMVQIKYSDLKIFAMKVKIIYCNLSDQILVLRFI